MKTEIKEKYGTLIANKDKLWERQFEKVHLRGGVNREHAFKLITLTSDYFENKYLSELAEDGHLDETYVHDFLEERNSFLSMVRHGIEE